MSQTSSLGIKARGNIAVNQVFDVEEDGSARIYVRGRNGDRVVL